MSIRTDRKKAAINNIEAAAEIDDISYCKGEQEREAAAEIEGKAEEEEQSKWEKESTTTFDRPRRCENGQSWAAISFHFQTEGQYRVNYGFMDFDKIEPSFSVKTN
ncbi:hypothetical protein KFK09_004839 [Dendrobium nobile]|uniref:Uncharacterized protein n=1 Tax=Dendrobium nobile TaxID=94219 RepID=A0A8T3BU26_DENNO|nr:hypothetical protein KFK09_004836 [Dendrobium nobile]KAI0522460.1 hypothetical protein KFK09_004839 [Dendrobium nobile]